MAAYIFRGLLIISTLVGAFAATITQYHGDHSYPSGMDSSLSPQLVRAFFTVNPSSFQEIEGIETRVKDEDEEKKKTCEFSKEYCNDFPFVSSKMPVVRKLDEMIHNALSQGDLPEVKPYYAASQITNLFEDVKKTVDQRNPMDGIPKKTNASATPEGWNRPKKEDYDRFGIEQRMESERHQARPYYPPRRPYYDWHKKPSQPEYSVRFQVVVQPGKVMIMRPNSP